MLPLAGNEILTDLKINFCSHRDPGKYIVDQFSNRVGRLTLSFATKKLFDSVEDR